MGGLPGQEKVGRCDGCGTAGAVWIRSRTPRARLPEQGRRLCTVCFSALEGGKILQLAFEAPQLRSAPPEEAFWWLFKAARALLEEGVSDEDQIVTTLVFAHEMDLGAGKGSPPASGGDIRMPPAYIVLRDVGGVRILKEDPTRSVHTNIVSERNADTGELAPARVFIRVSFRRKTPKPDRVAVSYEGALSAAEIRWGRPPSGAMEYAFSDEALVLSISNRAHAASRSLGEYEAPGGGSFFPPPGLVKTFYGGLIAELGERLAAPGRPFEAHNLIPACVAFLLRAYGGLPSCIQVQTLLNEHVYGEERLPEEGVATPESVRLWRDVPKVGRKIVRTRLLLWEHPRFMSWARPEHL